MALSTTARFGLTKYGAGSDPHPTRTEHNAMIDSVEAGGVFGSSGTLAARPAAGKGRAFYFATDDGPVGTIYYDTGTGWRDVSRVGGAAASGVLVGGASSEGVSTAAARVDHVHALPLATSLISGAMTATHWNMLNAATSAPTANTLVKNDANGRFQVAAPSAAADVTTKLYVDQAVATRAPSSHSHAWADITGTPVSYPATYHTHTWAEVTGKPTTFAPSAHVHSGSDITTGTVSDARIANATTALDGLLNKADKAKLDKASSASTPSTLMMTDANGRFQALAPAAGNDVANKTYVDAQVDTAAPASHTHTWASVTSKPTTFAPSSHTHPWSQVTGAPATYAPSDHNHSTSDITSGVFSAARLPVATGSVHGAMPAAMWTMLDDAAVYATPGTVARRNNGGQIQVATPGSDPDAANKGYVDDRINTRAPSSHNHSASQITSGTLSNDRLKNIGGGDTWLSLNSGRGAFRIASDGGIYFTYDDAITVGWSLGGALTSGTVPWSRITGEPSSYNPSSHNHPASQITSGTFAYERIRGTDQVHDRTATNRSVWVDADGRFGQNTSSIRFKENVRDANLDPAAVLRLRPRIYDRKNKAEGINEFGLIAEEVEAEVPELALYDRAGVLETVAYEKLAVALLEVAKTQDVEIKDLHRRLEEAGL